MKEPLAGTRASSLHIGLIFGTFVNEDRQWLSWRLCHLQPPTSHPLSQKGPFVSVLFVQSVRVLPVLQPSNLFIKFTPRKRDPGQKNPKPIDHFTRTSTSRHQCGSLYAFVHPSVVFLSVPLLSFGSSSNPNR
jgi:hypothetical protein